MTIEKREFSGWETKELAENLDYSKNDPEFADFAAWLETIVASEKFSKFANELIEIDERLKTEPVGKTRTELVKRRYNLIDDI